MSDDYVLEVPAGFLLSDEAMADTEGGTGSRHHFAAVRLLIKGVTPYQAGQHFEIPGVFQYREDKATQTWLNEGPRQFKGFTLGGKSRLYILVATKQDKNSNSYQMVKTLKSWREKDRDSGEYHYDWQNFQLPAIRQLSPDMVTALESGKTLYMEFESLGTGRKFKRQDEGEGEATYWGNFKVYPTAEALKAAEKEFFAQFNGAANGASGGLDLSNMPHIWNDAKNPEAGLGRLLKEIESKVKNGNYIDVAKELTLITQPGNKVANKLNSEEPVDLGALFIKALDCPEAMAGDVKAAFAHLYK